MVTHTVMVPAEDWDRLMAEMRILVDAYNDLFLTVTMLHAELEDRGVCDGMVYDSLDDALSRAINLKGGV